MLTKGGGGVSQKVTQDDNGVGGLENPKLADIICEQLISKYDASVQLDGLLF